MNPNDMHRDDNVTRNLASELRRQAGPNLDAARDALEDVNERFLTFAKERPVVTLAAAVAVGFVLGKIASRL